MAFLGLEAFGTTVGGNEADLDGFLSRSGRVHLIDTANR